MKTSILEYSSKDKGDALLVDLQSDYEYRETLADPVQEQYTQEEWDSLLLEQEIAQDHKEITEEELMLAWGIYHLYYDTYSELAAGILTIQNILQWCSISCEEIEYDEYKEVVGEWYEASCFVVDVRHKVHRLVIYMKEGGDDFWLRKETTPGDFARLQNAFSRKNASAYPIADVLPVLAAIERGNFIDEILADLET